MISVIFLLFFGALAIMAICSTFSYQGGGTSKTTFIHRVETTCIHCRRARNFNRTGIYR